MKFMTTIDAVFLRTFVSSFVDVSGNKQEKMKAIFLYGDRDDQLQIEMKDYDSLEKYKTYTIDVEIGINNFNNSQIISIKEA